MHADWKSLRRSFLDALGTPSHAFLVYSYVVRRKIVGDTKHPLVRVVAYKPDGSGSLRVQWMPVHHPYLDVTEAQLTKSSGALVNFGVGKTIVTFHFRRLG